jgi:ADP-ribose pyrophosphatase YjhB (NUDIX family)
MTAVDDLWFVATEAGQRAEQVYHRLSSAHEDYLEFATTRRVSRSRFRTVGERIERQGLPFGAHTLSYRADGRLLLVRQESLDKWVLPGGEVNDDETLREGARRELREESGVDVEYEGLGVLGEVTFRCGDHETWGVLPVFEGRALTTETEVRDPDGEITDAAWFADLPEDTRDRAVLREWRDRKFDE